LQQERSRPERQVDPRRTPSVSGERRTRDDGATEVERAVPAGYLGEQFPRVAVVENVHVPAGAEAVEAGRGVGRRRRERGGVRGRIDRVGEVARDGDARSQVPGRPVIVGSAPVVEDDPDRRVRRRDDAGDAGVVVVPAVAAEYRPVRDPRPPLAVDAGRQVCLLGRAVVAGVEQVVPTAQGADDRVFDRLGVGRPRFRDENIAGAPGVEPQGQRALVVGVGGPEDDRPGSESFGSATLARRV